MLQSSRLVVITLLLIGICSCSAPQKKVAPIPSQAQETKPESPETLLAQAQLKIAASERNALYLKAAKLYFNSNQIGQAKAALLDFEEEQAFDPSAAQYYELMLQISLYEQAQELAGDYAEKLQLRGFDQMPLDQQKQFIPLIADGYALSGQSIRAALWLIETHYLIDTETQPYINESIWRLLRQTPKNDLLAFQYDGDNIDAIGWLELAQSVMQNEVTLEQQFAALEQWQLAWGEHPANISQPTEIELLAQLPQTRPKRIVLALPFSGKLSSVGTAIRDGFAASHYLAKDDTALHFIDTNRLNAESLMEALTPEPDLIVGPIDRELLTQINDLDILSTPILALNRLDTLSEKNKHSNLYQFALTPETEATQIASSMCDAGYERIALIASSQDWGLRMAQAFKAAESLTNCSITSERYYNNNAELANTVADLLGTSASTQRKTRLSQITGQSLTFTPRRRADLDAIVMFARPEQARQLKPLFAFHYASDLPVFASSHAIDHAVEANENNDLNNLYYTDMPWSLSQTNPVRSIIARVQPKILNSYDRFFAFGADAHQLAPRLPLLQNVPDSTIEGHTGLLSMDLDGSILRSLEWAKIRNGAAIPTKIQPHQEL